jgi:two-component system chemotaxis sensor kinase CheA
MNPLLPLFLEETQELIESAGADLLALEQGQGNASSLLDGIFRHFHTLKGGAALFDFAPMTGLLHTAEDVLDAARQGHVPATPALVDALLRCLDDIKSWLPSIAEAEALPASAAAEAERTAALLLPLLQGNAPLMPSIADAAAPARSQPARMLRIAPERVDQMIALAGEAVIARNALQHLVARAGQEAAGAAFLRPLAAQAAVLDRLVRDWHDAALRLRLVPVAEIFARVPRLVRDLARQLGRELRVQIEGETLEADRDVLAGLSEPLMHLVRNALDHGVEDPAARRAAGKPAAASLTLRARRAGEMLVIEVEDDGRGLDSAALRRRAVAGGAVTEAEAAALSDEQAASLVFLPGISTAAQISTVSGRGVGMDAVRSAVEGAGGRVSIASRPGLGTCVSLSLPMQVSMTRVMTVRAGGLQFGVPLDAVRSLVRVARGRIRALPSGRDGGGGQAFALGEQILPLVGVADVLGLPASDVADDVWVLVVDAEQGAAGLAVAGFGARADVILRPLTGVLAGTAWYLGAALLGDGGVLLVLDVQALLR